MTLPNFGPPRKPRVWSMVSAVLLIVLYGLASCEQKPEPRESVFSGAIMGTTYTVKVAASLSGEQAKELGQDIQRILSRVDDLMSTYKADSELSRFNRHEKTTPFPLSEETARVFACALEVSRRSKGAFDITVGPLVNAWGFGPEEVEELPDDVQLKELRERVGFAKLHLNEEENTVFKDRPDVYCDLSAVAKGFAVDEVARILDDGGISDYMVEVGGEVRTRGRNPQGDFWQIGIYKPHPGVYEPERVLPLQNKAIATSGGYRNFITRDGIRYTHILDPRTGKPITHNLASATVVHDSCTWADAYATALMVLGSEEGYEFAVEHDLAVLLMIHGENDEFVLKATPAFQALFPEFL